MDVLPNKGEWKKAAEDAAMELGEKFYQNKVVFKIYRTHESILRYHVNNVQEVYKEILSD